MASILSIQRSILCKVYTRALRSSFSFGESTTSTSPSVMSSILLLNYMLSQDSDWIFLLCMNIVLLPAVEKCFNNFIMTDSDLRLAPSNLPHPNQKLLSSPRSPQPATLSREPRLARTNSQSKPPKRTSTQKYFKPNEIEQELKYSRPHKPQNILQSSLALSQANPIINFFPPHLEDSQETVQRPKNYSRDKHLRVSFEDREKGDMTKPFDVLSGMSASKVKKGSQYYAYWKNKAHEYLESNMKLMGEIRRLTSQNERLKQDLEKINRKQNPNQSNKHSDREQTQIKREQELSNELRRTTLHYLAKIQNMEKELKKKEVAIDSYQLQIAKLNHRVSGDAERLKLMARMRLQIQQLQNQIQKEDLIESQRTNSFHTLNMHSLDNPHWQKEYCFRSSTELQSPVKMGSSQLTRRNGLTPRKK